MQPISQATKGIRLENYQVELNRSARAENQEKIKPVKPVESITDRTIQNYDLEKTVEFINTQLANKNLELSFEKHTGTGRFVARLVDGETGDTIREVPSQRLLDYAANMNELLGILLDERV